METTDHEPTSELMPSPSARLLLRKPGTFSGIAALLVVLGGCGAHERQPADEAYLPPIIQLEAAPTVSSDRPIFDGCQLTLDRRIGSDDVTDVYSDPRLKVIDRSDGRIVQTFGKVGRGPLEFRTPIAMYWSTVRPGALEIYDQVNRRFWPSCQPSGHAAPLPAGRLRDAYNAVVVSDGLVYAVFDGEHRDGLGQSIHVFTWDGRFVVEYELDHLITAVQVSQDERSLWAGFDDPYPRVGEWTLPPLHEALDRLERGEAPGNIQLCSD